MGTRTRIMIAAELAAEGLSIWSIARQLDRHRVTIGLGLNAIRIERLYASVAEELRRPHIFCKLPAFVVPR